MHVLVDTSIWIDYFKSGLNSGKLDEILDDNRLFTNDIVLAELIPFLMIKKQHKIVDLLRNIPLLPLKIDWTEIIQWQVACLNAGINGIGIPDLILAQNSKQNRSAIYSLDKHFRLLSQVIDIPLF
ncbi:MAG: PIN domain-containing protein [Methylococcales bacterium]|nr:MAG: PIN domain-containing protein [Methylococcales bacterium]